MFATQSGLQHDDSAVVSDRRLDGDLAATPLRIVRPAVTGPVSSQRQQSAVSMLRRKSKENPPLSSILEPKVRQPKCPTPLEVEHY